MMSLARDLGGRFISGLNREFADTGFAWMNVSSSNVGSVGYNEQTATLGVRFLNGSEYHYFDVDPDMATALQSATSVGKFLAQFIKGHYAYERVA